MQAERMQLPSYGGLETVAPWSSTGSHDQFDNFLAAQYCAELSLS
jgi:hypothetical protein